MRKALIAVAVATALFAVGAFAASFATEAEDTASGSDIVRGCATTATIDFDETYSETSSNWNVTGINVTLSGGAEDCDGSDYHLVLENPAGDTVLDTTGTLAGLTLTLAAADFEADLTNGAPLTVAEVGNAAILVDGEQLTTDSA